MEYRLLGQTGVFVSRICLGTMTFGGSGQERYRAIGGLALPQAKALVHIALDAGVNFFDTADVYAGGESESLLGEALGARRRDVILATKAHARMGPGPNEVGQSRLHLMRAIEDSLRRLGTDWIDLYQIHNFDPLTPIEVMLRTLDDAVRQGKIRHVGCSNLAAWQVMKALGFSAKQGLERFESLQAYYSLAGRDVERELVPMVQDQQLGLLAWSPLAGGFLSGKFDRASSDPEARRAKVDFPPIDRERTYDVIDVLRTVAKRQKASVSQVALAWVLSRPGVTSVIVGAKREDQLRDNLGALTLQLESQDLEALDAASKLAPSYPGWVQAWRQADRWPASTQGTST
ncbi:aldo/keto reductase [Variovorax sp. OV084]|jgi:aryl-alcohol dehydrogenase-like predicted oxidoreductase|uniref:aldo/keto reductase n=1 Tax=Variovorax TaxID=34072 RepID=UPI0008D7D5AE|nr:aldo/keto reductase [Variovorax sp. OV084]SEU04466.1 Predicted oxidoreductase [Variovorax sp. OV084]